MLPNTDMCCVLSPSTTGQICIQCKNTIGSKHAKNIEITDAEIN